MQQAIILFIIENKNYIIESDGKKVILDGDSCNYSGIFESLIDLFERFLDAWEQGPFEEDLFKGKEETKMILTRIDHKYGILEIDGCRMKVDIRESVLELNEDAEKYKNEYAILQEIPSRRNDKRQIRETKHWIDDRIEDSIDY